MLENPAELFNKLKCCDTRDFFYLQSYYFEIKLHEYYLLFIKQIISFRA